MRSYHTKTNSKPIVLVTERNQVYPNHYLYFKEHKFEALRTGLLRFLNEKRVVYNCHMSFKA